MFIPCLLFLPLLYRYLTLQFPLYCRSYAAPSAPALLSEEAQKALTSSLWRQKDASDAPAAVSFAEGWGAPAQQRPSTLSWKGVRLARQRSWIVPRYGE